MTQGTGTGLSQLDRAQIALMKAQHGLEMLDRIRSEPIAIVGMACRYPGGVNTLSSYWDLLSRRVDAISETRARWPDAAAGAAPEVRWAGLLDSVDAFDAELFHIAPREAVKLDPQQRLLLELTWEALEDAGYAPDGLVGAPAGVFVGISSADYAQLLTAAPPADVDAYNGTGNSSSFAAGRVSYVFGFQGPSVAIDTVCSSSLVATHLACQSLRTQECDLALAAGVNLILSPRSMDILVPLKALSPDGRCKTFDARANGFVRGEGCGVLVLKRLSDALRDGDCIWGLIRGSAVNQDGSSTALTAPNMLAQQQLLRRALAQAKLSPSDIGYIEAHGTGTSLGDPIEVEALSSVFGAARADGSSCALGSVKTNIGHLEAAAGVAGLMKSVLALHHECIPAHLHLRALNPRMSLEGTPFVIPTSELAWPRGAKPRRAGVSSFGMSGTNAHVVLEEAPSRPASAKPDVERPVHVIPVSANTAEALRALAGKYAQRLAQTEDRLEDIAHTAGAGRSRLPERLAVVARTKQQAQERLEAFARGETAAECARGRADRSKPAKIGFFFADGGAHYPGMGRSLYETEPVFRQALDRCDAEMKRIAGRSLLGVMLGGGASGAALDEAEDTLPALFALQFALCELWRSWGAMPDAVMGHGAGEYAAACAADVLTMEEGLQLIIERSRSPQAEPTSGPSDKAAPTTFKAPSILLIPHEAGLMARLEPARAESWRRAVGEAIAAERGVEVLRAKGIDVFLEVGPHPARFGAEAARIEDAAECAWLPSLCQGRGEWETMLSSLGELFVRGAGVDWKRFDAPYARRRVRLPTYTFQRTRYWFESKSRPQSRRGQETGHELLGEQVALGGEGALFENRLSPRDGHYLADHRVLGKVVVPAAGLLEMMSAAGAKVTGAKVRVNDLLVLAPLVLDDPAGRDAQVVVAEPVEGRRSVKIYSRKASGDGAWTLHVSGVLSELGGAGAAPVDVAGLRARCAEPQDVDAAYAAFEQQGLGLGESFRGMEALWAAPGEMLARVRLPARCAKQAPEYGIHPVLLDTALQVLASIVMRGAAEDRLYLPFGAAGYAQRTDAAERGWVHARLTSDPRREVVTGDVQILDDEGRVVAEVAGLQCKQAPSHALQRASTSTTEQAIYRLEWVESAPQAEVPPVRGRWLILADHEELAEALVRELCARGGEGRFATWPEAKRELEAGGAFEGVVRIWERASGEGSPADRAESRAVGALELTQALVRSGRVKRLLCVTQGAQPVAPGDAVDMASSALWGLGRAVFQEHPELSCRLIDVDELAGGLWREVVSGDAENQVALRSGKRWVARLVKAPREPDTFSPETPNYRLESSKRGLLESLQWVPTSRRAPGPAEVEIEVRAAGLNFRDVLNALGMYPGDAGLLGGDCAGVVAAVGEGVQHVAVGDAVMGLVPGSFGRYVTVDARQVIRRPPEWTWEQAASVPTVFLTAWYALRELADLRAGERILVHAAAGGVGMAAVQLARWMGAEVLATASASKHEVLRAMGVEAIADSRSLDYAEAWSRTKRPGGIDVVLNALAGDHVDKSLSLLSPGGRFLEMGKTDVRSVSDVASKHPGVLYRAFDLLEAGPARIQEMLTQILAGFAGGRLRPLPVTSFEMRQAQAAFRFMAQARHVGKIVLRAPGLETKRPDATALITGGLGGLGLLVARWLIEKHGIAHLVLVGRKTPSPAQLAKVEELRALGARVTVAQADVADRAQVEALMSSLGRESLRGVIHAAGVLEDGILMQQNGRRFAQVFTPKAQGAWNLHEATRGLSLDFFVLFSSAAAMLGSAGQSNYAAANSFLDGLAHHRRTQGLCGLSLNWGAWLGAGMAASLGQPDRVRLARLGVGSHTPAEGLALLEDAWLRSDPQLGLFKLDLPASAQAAAADEVPPLWRSLIVQTGAPPRRAAPSSSASSPIARLASLSPAEQRSEIESTLRLEVAKVLSLPTSSAVPLATPLKELGLDSLMAVELRNMLTAHIGQTLPVTLAFDFPTVKQMTDYLLTEHLVKPTEHPAPVDAPAALAKIPARRGIPVGSDEPIAIVGMACRFPGSDNPRAFWETLIAGRDCTSEIPSSRWDVARYYDARPGTPGKMISRRGGFLSKVTGFDADFFGIAGIEAEAMDPQQRFLLTVAWEAMESARLSPRRLAGSKTGVFAGLCNFDYARLLFTQALSVSPYAGTGGSLAIAANRLSYFFDLRGPSLTVDTACSSSLVAAHLACQSLRMGESDLALVGGANLILAPEVSIALSQAGMLAPDGRCKAFDAAADGFARGEGCAVVVLKRLSDALRDHDRIVATLVGSAVNQDGRSNGLTAPNGPAQQAVVEQALEDAGVTPSDVGFVEAHGSGTPLGDPIEFNALRKVLDRRRTPDSRCWIGSVKTNIGHLEGAAGIAGLMKAALAVHHGTIPPHLHVRTLNPHLDSADGRFAVPTACEPWPASGARRIAGVSSFGFGGTNAHVLVAQHGNP
ncbi:SDR family NAD(P)-dependent oxidoreductase [Sorangium sp. So ce448]|uniref:SDR family NAD(P)-dependent oxidoreductase n=1 Tax=Sorangium sp. So ce448 TaxID=3133314 RepID=UPI003F62758B